MTSERATMLVNRVRKNRRGLKAWIKREQVTCYRLYDRDIPEIPMAIDWYEGALHASVYTRQRPLPLEEARGLLEALGDALGVPAALCFIKTRVRQKGAAQYEGFGGEEATRVVHEAGLKFEVNLSDYLDTGLFLDHRAARRWVAEEAQGKRVLNLYCYTGAFTVHAAQAGARETISVDLSKTYLAWAERNLALNGMRVGVRHQLLRTDVAEYLNEAPADYFDLVVFDPPTFSNSKSMDGTLDIQRDHGALLQRLARCVVRGGAVYFSTNHRRFTLDEAVGDAWKVEDRTSASLPLDFRDGKVHQLWRLEKR
jgi:23S rRNA G2069 N7-methylase RlmK/C1962 C5-methylase RlmI